MSELGFTINSEKSFFDEPDKERPSHTFFRESCGGDYKGGVDVRPYMPECDLQQEGLVSRNEFIAWCHKMVNGLLRRWTIEEIPQTVLYLLKEINNKKRKICLVPSWEVDHAGIKHYIPPYLALGLDIDGIKYVKSVPTYYRLVFIKKKRPRKLEERPYVWFAYWLKRSSTLSSSPQLVDPYSSAVELAGEPRKGKEGAFRWVLTA
jgi:hypothetical protein